MKFKTWMSAGAATLLAATIYADDLPWVCDASTRPTDIVAVQESVPAIDLAASSAAESDPLAYFNSFYAQVFQLDGLSVFLPRHLYIIVR